MAHYVPFRAIRAGHQLSIAEHAETLIVTGTARALHDAGDELTWCGDQVAVNGDIHRFGGPALLSQFQGRRLRPGRRRDESWELMVLADGRHFRHRPGRAT